MSECVSEYVNTTYGACVSLESKCTILDEATLIEYGLDHKDPNSYYYGINYNHTNCNKNCNNTIVNKEIHHPDNRNTTAYQYVWTNTNDGNCNTKCINGATINKLKCKDNICNSGIVQF